MIDEAEEQHYESEGQTNDGQEDFLSGGHTAL